VRRLALLFSFLLIGAGTCPFSWADPARPQHRHSNAANRQLLLSIAAEDTTTLAAQYGLSVVAETTNPAGHFVVVEGSGQVTAAQLEALLHDDRRIRSSDRIQLAGLPRTSHAAAPPAMGDVAIDRLKTGTFSTPCLNQALHEAPWAGYADQDASRLVRLHEGHSAQAACGSARVAILDTGVDPDHPMLAGALQPGFDFLLGRQGIPSEWDFLDQSLQPILDQSLQPILDQSLQPILDQSLQPILDAVQDGEAEVVTLGSSFGVLLDQATAAEVEGMVVPPFFGHGTMVAGIVRLVSPGSQIMPLRVFNGSGSAHLFDIIEAIYFAVENGADVINMSFSMPDGSQELQRAIQYARSQGVVCIASAGNHGEQTHVFPAKLPDTVGVAATTLSDELSTFSNYGSALVDLGAPGNAIVSTYPGGVFAAGWGTSFSAPFVAGTAALIHNADGGATGLQSTLRGLRQGAATIPNLAGDIGNGRLDVLGAVLAGID